MSQRHRIQNNATMLITTVTHQREPFFADPAVAREAVETLLRVQKLHLFILHAFVVMPDHIHIVATISAPNSVSKILNVYKSGLTFNTGIRKMWQARSDMRIVKNLAGAIYYVHQNPIYAGLTKNPTEYPWSSACAEWTPVAAVPGRGP
jgi:putative transposase